jgi:hypothetical protein
VRTRSFIIYLIIYLKTVYKRLLISYRAARLRVYRRSQAQELPNMRNTAGDSYSAWALRFTMKTGDQAERNLANSDVSVCRLKNWPELRVAFAERLLLSANTISGRLPDC